MLTPDFLSVSSFDYRLNKTVMQLQAASDLIYRMIHQFNS